MKNKPLKQTCIILLMTLLASISATASEQHQMHRKEGFITEVDWPKKTISINEKKFRMSPNLQVKFFSGKNASPSMLIAGESVFYRLLPGVREKTKVVVNIWIYKN